MSRRRLHSTERRSQSQIPHSPVESASATPKRNGHDPHSADQHHSHSLFNSHSHSHGEDENNHGVEKVMYVLKGSGDRGSRITLIGLFANIILTAAKGGAGWYMHSASLLADAGHSLSDLLGDFVTLFCWKLSRKPSSERYPYGFAKFETLGTTAVSLLLIGGSLGIGFHSYHLLIETLTTTTTTIPPGPLRDILETVVSSAPHFTGIGEAHARALDPNAAWFAGLSIVSKEWLYRVTKTVADEEKSPVLLANAIHHRSDAYSSVVALLAIMGSWCFPALPLDPIGGLIVSFVVLRQGLGIFSGAWGQLTDAGVSLQTQEKLLRLLDPLVFPHGHDSPRAESHIDANSRIQAIRHLRARRAGSLMFVDVNVEVSRTLSVADASELEGRIASVLKNARKEVREVNVKFHPV